MIPFNQHFSVTYGAAEAVSPLVRRVVARNPGPFTFTGTGAHIVGSGQVAVIDPGPDDPAQLEAILEATEGETITHIFVTHAHLDHSPLARPLAQASGAVIFAGGARCRPSGGEDRLEAGDDLAFRPDVPILDGARFEGRGWTIEAVATPGHTASHFAYALAEDNALFPGDCVMGWSTSVVSPPDGDMRCYMASLTKISRRGYARLLPAHGPPIEQPGPFLDAYIGHRLARERQILDALDAHGPSTIRRLVPTVYAGTPPHMHPAACHSMLAHLIDLVRRGLVDCADGLPTIGAVYRLARLRRAA